MSTATIVMLFILAVVGVIIYLYIVRAIYRDKQNTLEHFKSDIEQLQKKFAQYPKLHARVAVGFAEFVKDVNALKPSDSYVYFDKIGYHLSGYRYAAEDVEKQVIAVKRRMKVVHHHRELMQGVGDQVKRGSAEEQILALPIEDDYIANNLDFLQTLLAECEGNTAS